MDQSNNLKMVFHTDFEEEFSGASADDIVVELYHNSKQGNDDLSFNEWWAYQQKLWQEKYDIAIPPFEEEGSSQALVDVLNRVGALKIGPLPGKDMNGLTNGR